MAAADPVPETLSVHGLLVCRNAEVGEGGRLNLEEVLEVVAVDGFPGDAGPLTFVAFVRNLPPGPGTCAFVLRPVGEGGPGTARLPLEVDVGPSLAGRQVALQIRVPSLPVAQGGWYEVAFEWEGTPLAANRFAIGARGDSAGD